MASASPANSPAPAASTSPSSAPPAFDPEPLCSALDAHLERYLHLLAEYTSLRETLHAQLSSVSLATSPLSSPPNYQRFQDIQLTSPPSRGQHAGLPLPRAG